MQILIVNNRGQFNHLIGRSIRDKVESRMISNETPVEDIEADGLILGGGPSLETAGKCGQYLLELDLPMLGICLGMQVMGTTFGGKVCPGSVGGYAEVDVEILKENDIFRGLPGSIRTWASHADQVTRIPPDFEVLARSKVCEIEAMKHKSKPLYGLQWHPEVVHTEHGDRVFENFIEICKK